MLHDDVSDERSRRLRDLSEAAMARFVWDNFVDPKYKPKREEKKEK